MHETLAKISLPEGLKDTVYRASELRLRKQRMEELTPLSSGIPNLDEILGGGWPRSALSEICGHISSGRFSTLLSALRVCLGTGCSAALIDQGQHLDPRGARQLGLQLDQLLWIRPTSINDSLACAEMVLSAGFLLVVIDLGLSPVAGHVAPAVWLRVARLSASHQAVTLLGSPFRISGCAARVVLRMRNDRSRWLGTPGQIRLLEGLRNRIEILRSPQLIRQSVAGFSADLPEAERIEHRMIAHQEILEVKQHA